MGRPRISFLSFLYGSSISARHEKEAGQWHKQMGHDRISGQKMNNSHTLCPSSWQRLLNLGHIAAGLADILIPDHHMGRIISRSRKGTARRAGILHQQIQKHSRQHRRNCHSGNVCDGLPKAFRHGTEQVRKRHNHHDTSSGRTSGRPDLDVHERQSQAQMACNRVLRDAQGAGFIPA